MIFRCSKCRKDVESDQHGNLFCDCFDERLSPNANVGWWHEHEYRRIDDEPDLDPSPRRTPNGDARP
jgi:hypothetical protein